MPQLDSLYTYPTKENVVGFFNYWQVPAKTELAAYQAILEENFSDDVLYLAFPWATLIDSLKSRSLSMSAKLLSELAYIQKQLRRKEHKRVVTVCQQIFCLDFLYLFESCGVTDIFWSHKTKNIDKKNGITFHPFPLYPAQTYESNDLDKFKKPLQERKLLTNFIGAFNPKVYLSNVRARIFEDAGKHKDCLIIKRESWHFDRQVYQHQMKGLAAADEVLLREEIQKREYLEAIGNSVFTLCPTGSGPNSIRIWEAIQLGSIPVILTLYLDLPGEQEMWEEACIFCEDSQEGYARALNIIRDMDDAEKQFRCKAVNKLEKELLPNSYGKIITKAVSDGS